MTTKLEEFEKLVKMGLKITPLIPGTKITMLKQWTEWNYHKTKSVISSDFCDTVSDISEWIPHLGFACPLALELSAGPDFRSCSRAFSASFSGHKL